MGLGVCIRAVPRGKFVENLLNFTENWRIFGLKLVNKEQKYFNFTVIANLSKFTALCRTLFAENAKIHQILAPNSMEIGILTFFAR